MKSEISANRRPIKSRESGWAKRIAALLAAQAITPNQISQASIGFALNSALAFAATAWVADGFFTGLFLIAGIVGCQLRLAANLFDGMVAVEGGKHEADGPIWNEMPDRISDILICLGVGIGVGNIALGLAAAVIAVLVAYAREFGNGLRLVSDYRGPLAKRQRMDLLCLAAFATIFESIFITPGTMLTLALWIIVLGGFVTFMRRCARIRALLIARSAVSSDGPVHS